MTLNQTDYNQVEPDKNNLDYQDIDYKISLLEERLQVARHRQKIGEIIVRKEVETKFVKVPIRREKLIVERIGENPQQLAEVVLGEEKASGFGYDELQETQGLDIIKSNFVDVATAQELLNSLASLNSTNKHKIRIEIVTDSSEDKAKYQEICDRASDK